MEDPVAQGLLRAVDASVTRRERVQAKRDGAPWLARTPGKPVTT